MRTDLLLLCGILLLSFPGVAANLAPPAITGSVPVAPPASAPEIEIQKHRLCDIIGRLSPVAFTLKQQGKSQDELLQRWTGKLQDQGPKGQVARSLIADMLKQVYNPAKANADKMSLVNDAVASCLIQADPLLRALPETKAASPPQTPAGVPPGPPAASPTVLPPAPQG